MKNHHNPPEANQFDCGDGVPNLPLIVADPAGRDPSRGPWVDARTAVMGLVIVGQMVLLLAVLAGGNAVVGAAAGAALLVCGLTILTIRKAHQATRDH